MARARPRLFNCLTRLYTPAAGDILFDGRIDPRQVRRIKSPISASAAPFRTSPCFAICRFFDNVRIGGHCRSRSDYFSDALHLPWTRRCGGVARAPFAGNHRLSRPCTTSRDRRVADLPFGTQKRVELARALVSLAQAPFARRAGLRPEPSRGRGAWLNFPPDSRRSGGHHPGRRTSHESRHVDLRSGGRAQLRPQDRGGSARDGAARSAKSSAPISDRAYMTALLEVRGVARLLRRDAGAAWPRFQARRRRRYDACSAATAPARRRPCERCAG